MFLKMKMFEKIKKNQLNYRRNYDDDLSIKKSIKCLYHPEYLHFLSISNKIKYFI
jgi:hypothetical protein